MVVESGRIKSFALHVLVVVMLILVKMGQSNFQFDCIKYPVQVEGELQIGVCIQCKFRLLQWIHVKACGILWSLN